MKTVSELKYQDIVYHPEVDEVKEYKIKSICLNERGATVEVFGMGYPMYAGHNDILFNSTLHPFYISKSEAIYAQRCLQLKRIKDLQQTIQQCMNEINELTNKLTEKNEG